MRKVIVSILKLWISRSTSRSELDGLHRILLYVANHKKLFVATLGTTFLSAIFEGGTIVILGVAVKVLSNPDVVIPEQIAKLLSPSIAQKLVAFEPSKLFVVLIVLAIATQCFKSLLEFFTSVCSTYLSTAVRRDAAIYATNQVMSWDYGALSRYPGGKVASLVEQTSVSSVVVSQLTMTVQSLSMLVIYSIVTIGVSWYLSIGLIGALILLWYSTKFIAERLRTYTKRETHSEIAVLKLMFEYLNSGRLLRIVNSTKAAGQAINDQRDISLFSKRRGNVLQSVVKPGLEATSIVALGIALIAVYYFSGGIIGNVDSLFIFAVVILRARTYIAMLNQVRIKLSRTMPRVGIVESFVTSKGKTFERTGGVKFVGIEHEIEFKNVSFSYAASSRDVLEDISFRIPRNKTIALIGPSGVGKSTIINLLLGLYEPSTGCIEVDGTKLSEIKLSDWRANLGVVDQEVLLLSGSVSKNIAFARPEASFNEIKTAAIQANAHEFIENTRDGYDTMLGEDGVALSGGQKQRIALARALLNSPELLILDEPTSALDIASENLVRTSLEGIYGEKTIIIISHKLSMLRNVDWVVVLENGRVAEQGPKDDLLLKDDHFATIIEENFASKDRSS